MSYSHPLKRVRPILFLAVLAAVPFAHSASEEGPPPVIAALSGQWTGESSRTLTGAQTTERSANARRYWVEGNVVRGEILSNAGGRLEAARVAILPRDFGFLKILTFEGDAPETFVGVPSEGGVLWSAVGSDRIRYIERVMGTGDDRRLEVLLVEDPGEQTHIIETLLPSNDALTGVIGSDIQSVEEIEPLVLPPMAEMQLLDRIGELTKQRDAARVDSGNMARELAAAWRQSEEMEARLAGQESEAAKPTAAESSVASESEAEITMRLQSAETELIEARRWADDLERSLRDETARADAAGERVEILEANLLTVASERDGLMGQLAERQADTEAALARQAELEESLAASASERDEALDTAAEQAELLAEQNEQLSKVGAQLEQAREETDRLNQSVAELQTQLEKSVPASVADNNKVELAAAIASVAELRTQVETMEAEVAQDAAEKQQQAGEIEELRTQLALAISERDEAGANLEAALARVDDAGATREQVEQLTGELADARATVSALENSKTELEQAVSEARSVSTASVNESKSEIARLGALLSGAELARGQADKEIESLREELEEARQNASESEAQLAALQEELEGSDESLARRLGELESQATAAESARAELEQRNLDLEESLNTALAARATAEEEAARVRGDLELAGDNLARIQSEMAELQLRSESDRAEDPDARVLQLEARLADTYERSEQRQEEIEELTADVAGLEAENQKLAARVADLAARIAADRPEEGTLAENSVLAQLKQELADEKAARQDLEDANRSLAVQLRELEIQLAEARDLENRPATAPPASMSVAGKPVVAETRPPTESTAAVQFRSQPTPAPVASTPVRPANVDSASGVAFRAPNATQPVTAPQSVRRAPTRPDAAQTASFYAPSVNAGPPGQNAFLVQVVRRLPVNGFRRAAADSLVVIDGKTYKVGQIVDTEHGLRFKRVDSDSIVFSGPDGGEYRFSL